MPDDFGVGILGVDPSIATRAGPGVVSALALGMQQRREKVTGTDSPAGHSAIAFSFPLLGSTGDGRHCSHGLIQAERGVLGKERPPLPGMVVSDWAPAVAGGFTSVNGLTSSWALVVRRALVSWRWSLRTFSALYRARGSEVRLRPGNRWLSAPASSAPPAAPAEERQPRRDVGAMIRAKR